MNTTDKDQETIDDLIINNLKIIQSRSGFRFSLDAVLLAHFVSLQAGNRVLDLGTGNGVIPLLLTTRASRLQIHGLEIQPAMVELARRSVQLNGLAHLIQIDQGDLREADNRYGLAVFDLVVCNPPFQKVGTGKINPNPAIALARHELACCLEDVVRIGALVLKPGGRLALIQRPQRLAEIFELFSRYGLTARRLRLVYPQVHRAPNLVLIEGAKGGKSELKVLPPLVVYEAGGGYTREIQQIYYGEQRGFNQGEPE
ncbi:MAG: tRNA1(Val) (adenine(37)-N6)-methyltransferase [Firmicutes bacterium]|nr:tRNA1(Val) (adenine(37)-N6)-methyltransferase [Bacillota bacterium]